MLLLSNFDVLEDPEKDSLKGRSDEQYFQVVLAQDLYYRSAWERRTQQDLVTTPHSAEVKVKNQESTGVQVHVFTDGLDCYF